VTTALEQRGIDVIRGLAMDAVKRANSGHTGTAMALAPLAHVLWTRVLTYDAADPDWPDRDRFVLSSGHASMLLYAMLHLTGHGLTRDDIRDFRQWGSATPGHPEAGHTAGVEVTTGPLGQGFANAVGMAVAERHLRARFGPDVVDHRTFVVCSDGDLMEGISHEAASWAGHQRLGRLVAVYDDNRITIDGSTDLALSDDAARRFAAYGWHVLVLGEVANDTARLEAALRDAMAVEDRPSLLVLRSHIGYGLPTQVDTAAAHGAITDDAELATARQTLGLPADGSFWVPDDVAAMYAAAGRRGAARREAWQRRHEAARRRHPELDAVLAARGLPGWQDALPTWDPGASVATRKASNQCLDAMAPGVPALLAGGADLTGNTGTEMKADPLDAHHPEGRLVYFGVREHGMGAIANGMARHGGVLPAVGTFMVFSDYMRPAIRLAAISATRTVFIFSHDSVGVGEDGPTHQPIEHLAALRAMPGLVVLRPADATETAGAWRAVLELDGPAALVLTRQNVPVLAGTDAGAVARGGYTVVDAADPHVVLVGTGSEVQHCVGAAEELAAEGVRARVVSLPSWELFAAQEEAYRLDVLPPDVPTVAVEAAATFGWDRYADTVVGIDRFGASAPGDVVMQRFGFTAAHVAEVALGRVRREGELR
jgi:transketolase